MLPEMVAGSRFLPTPSARRATSRDNWANKDSLISTHALREEGDGPAGRRRRGIPISTHALREEGDDILEDYVQEAGQFLPTPSARRATFFSPSSTRTS